MLHSRLDERFGFENLIYASESMEGVVNRLRRIAPTDAGVLITGETGAGKDVVAQAIHQNSPPQKKAIRSDQHRRGGRALGRERIVRAR